MTAKSKTNKVPFPISDKRFEHLVKEKVVVKGQSGESKKKVVVSEQKKYVEVKQKVVPVKKQKHVTFAVNSSLRIINVVNRDCERVVRKVNEYSVFDFSASDFHDYDVTACLNVKMPKTKWIAKLPNKLGPILKWVPKSV